MLYNIYRRSTKKPDSPKVAANGPKGGIYMWNLRSKAYKHLKISAKIFVLLGTVLIMGIALANPSGGVVSSGNATIQQTPGNTVIRQNSQQAIINWQSFNIGSNESTHFQQPTGGVALNRISPQQGASQIFGQLSATGTIILINQAGIYFGSGASVNVGSIIASTSDITDANFLAGKYIFNQPSSYNGSVINEGRLLQLIMV